MTQINYPNLNLTPGDTISISKDRLCKIGYTKDARAVTSKLKLEVFKLYGLKQDTFKTSDYEVDHFISLELGGSNSIKNLWPEKYCPVGNKPLVTGCYGAREKDRVETNLHRRICKGEMTIKEAQEIIKTDWIKYYKGLVK